MQSQQSELERLREFCSFTTAVANFLYKTDIAYLLFLLHSREKQLGHVGEF
jgi:hypothetical protein